MHCPYKQDVHDVVPPVFATEFDCLLTCNGVTRVSLLLLGETH